MKCVEGERVVVNVSLDLFLTFFKCKKNISGKIDDNHVYESLTLEDSNLERHILHFN